MGYAKESSVWNLSLGLFAVWISAFAPTIHARSVVEYCSPYGLFGNVTFDPSQPFLPYSLIVTDLGGNRKKVSVVADELQITRDNLGALVKAANSADPSLVALAIDARRITFKEQLSFVDGAVEFLADEISFEPDSVITQLPQTANSGVSLTANTIRVSGSGFHHFDLRMRPQPNNDPDPYSDIPLMLSLHATHMYVDNNEVSALDAPKVLSKMFTLAPLFDYSTKISAELGQSGESTWLNATKAHGQWPAYSVAVWRAEMSIAPFDACVIDDLTARLRRYAPLMGKVASASTNMQVDRLSNSLTAGTDLNGNGPAWITNLPLSELRNRVSEYSAGTRLAAVDSYIALLTQLSTDTPIDPTAAIAAQTQRIQELVLAFQITTNELDVAQTSLAAKMLRLDGLKAAYVEREQRLKDHADELKKGAQDRAQLLAGLSTAASLVTLAFTGDPNSAAAAGGIVNAVGAASGGANAWTSLATGYQFYTAIQKPLGEVSSAVTSFNDARSTYDSFIKSFTLGNITIADSIQVQVKDPQTGKITTKTIKRDDAIKDLQTKGDAVKKGLDDTYSAYQNFKEPTTDTPPDVEEDDNLKAIAGEITAALDETKQLTLSIEALQRSAQDNQGELTQVAEHIASLRDATISNEQKRKELMNLCLEGVRDELAEFTHTVDLLRRASVVEYRKPLPISLSTLQNVLVMQEIGSSWDPAKVLTNKDSADQYINLLTTRRQYVSLLARRIELISRQQLDDYVERRGRTPLVNVAMEDISNGFFSSESQKAFIDLLNATLDEQFTARKDPKALAVLYARRLEIPLDLKRKLDARFPARLLKVAVTSADISGRAGGADLIFTIDVERVGNLRQAESIAAPESDELIAKPPACGTATTVPPCFTVDLRTKETPFENYFVPYEYTLGQIRSGTAFAPTSEQSYWYLAGDTTPEEGRTMLITYPPAEARMYLRARLNTSTPSHFWESAPHVRRLTFVVEVFQ